MHSTHFTPAKTFKTDDMYVKAQNAELYCRTIGNSNDDPIIVIHGGPGLSMDYLLPSMDALANDYFVIFYDQRGNGKSTSLINSETGTTNNEEMNLAQFINDIETIQNHFGYQKVSLLGHSWGAYLAMSYATTFSERINQLILLNSIPIALSENAGQHDPYETMINNILTSYACEINDAQGMIKFYNDLFQSFFYNASLVPQLNLDKMSAKQVKISALMHQIFEQNLFHQPHDMREQLKKLQNIPTLIVHGKSHDIPESVAQEIHSLIKGSVLTVLECGHFPYIEKRKELFECIEKFNQANLKNTMPYRS